MKVYAFAKGFIEDIWEKDIKIKLISEWQPSKFRLYIYGKECYKFGFSIFFMILAFLASIKNFLLRRPDRIPVTHSIYFFRIHFRLSKKRYEWSNDFRKRFSRLLQKKWMTSKYSKIFKLFRIFIFPFI